MGSHRALNPKAEGRPWPETEQRSPYPQRPPRRAEDRPYVGGCASRIRCASDLLAAPLRLIPGWITEEGILGPQRGKLSSATGTQQQWDRSRGSRMSLPYRGSPLKKGM